MRQVEVLDGRVVDVPEVIGLSCVDCDKTLDDSTALLSECGRVSRCESCDHGRRIARLTRGER